MTKFIAKSVAFVDASLAKQIVEHHLKLLGLPQKDWLMIFDRPSSANAEDVRMHASSGKICIVLLPKVGFVQAFGIQAMRYTTQEACQSLWYRNANQTLFSLKTLHSVQAWQHPSAQVILSDKEGRAIWLWQPYGQGGILIIGTDLTGDLLRYRQGDPAQAKNRPTEAKWGIAGERPTYLFESQLAGEDGTLRHADNWAMALAETLSGLSGEPLLDILPGGAPGAIVITGDDDQAYLEKYDEQLKLLGDTPITYLLHPLTHHTAKTLRAMQKRNPNVDFGIHPDALDAPANYDALMDDQAAWFRGLTGTTPISLRNHGFLNDGYWGHLDSWLKHGVRISSNLPGLDGYVLNGSLLPARMVWKGNLTDHWSILTAIGDGVRFISGMSDQDAADRVWTLADRIRTSGLPGVMVLNLHPQNIAETRAMHEAAKDVIRSGFVAWNLRQCLNWFDSRDGGLLQTQHEQRSWLARQWAAFHSRLDKRKQVIAT